MRENSRRGAPRQARAAGRTGTPRDARGRGSGGRGSGPGAGRSGYDGGRPGPGNRGSAPGTADTARVASLIEPVLKAMDIDLEAVKIAAAGRRRVLRIIVDADGGVSLDDIAEVSREVSARLDARNAMGDAPYTLEVSSPGVDRPLTQPRHWRRAIGRLVVVALTEEDHPSQREAPDGPVDQEARVIDADQQSVTLEIGGAQRTVSYSRLGPGRVQVEFGRLPEEDDADPAGLGDPSGQDESWNGPDEEGPDGH
ncbi:MAG TPA: ribosome maturation factor RimP [Streptosporangiaceae bacterium]|nr:ribosome maturation factor RimP [Streptosporangiaceae bacterium]